MLKQADQSEVPTRDPRRWWVLAVMSLGTLIVFLDLSVVNTSLPSISQDLGASTSQLQWVVDGYVLMLAGLLLLAGSIGDRYGRKRWMSAGLVMFAAGSVVAALAGTIEVLVAGRALQGLGAAFVLPSTLSIVTNVFDREERPKAIAIWTAVGGMGIGLGPAVGGYLVEQWDWSAAFWIHIPIIAIALAGQFIVPESRDERDIGLDVPGTITATLGIIALVFGIIQGTEAGWTSPLIVGSFALGAVLLAAFIQIERTAAHPMLPLRFFKNKDFTGSVIVLGLMFFAVPAAFFFLTQFFQIIQGRGPFESGLLILPMAGPIILASGLAPKLVGILGPRRLVTLSVSIMTVAVVLFTTIDFSTGTWVIIANNMLLGFGFGLGAPALTDAVMASVPVEDAGIGSAVNDVSRELGSALGVAIIGTFINGFYISNLDDQLAGQVPADVLDTAKEGIGVLAATSESLPADVAQTTFAGASEAFVSAMSSGFWLSAAVLAGGAAIALTLLPNKVREDQAERESDAPSTDPDADLYRAGDQDDLAIDDEEVLVGR